MYYVDSLSGPSGRATSGSSSHRRDSNGGGGSISGSWSGMNSNNGGGGGSRLPAGPYARPVDNLGGPTAANVKASSTTSEFTKRKNWSQHIIDEIQVSSLSLSFLLSPFIINLLSMLLLRTSRSMMLDDFGYCGLNYLNFNHLFFIFFSHV